MRSLSINSIRNKLDYWRYADINGVLVLLYHSIANPKSDPHRICVPPNVFVEHIKMLKNHYRFIGPDDLYHALRKRIELKKSILVTFDDGYENNFTVAAKILAKEYIPALFFVNTYPVISGESFWWDRIDKLGLVGKYKRNINPYWTLCDKDKKGALPPVTIRGLQKISKNKFFSIGAHTHYHSCLAALPHKLQEEQILFSQSLLKKWLDRPVHYFAYPFGGLGDFNSSTQTIVRKHFRLGFTTQPFLANPQLYPTLIPRFNVTNISSNDLLNELKARFPQFTS